MFCFPSYKLRQVFTQPVETARNFRSCGRALRAGSEARVVNGFACRVTAFCTDSNLLLTFCFSSLLFGTSCRIISLANVWRLQTFSALVPHKIILFVSKDMYCYKGTFYAKKCIDPIVFCFTVKYIFYFLLINAVAVQSGASWLPRKIGCWIG